MKEALNQRDQILAYLRSGNLLTQYEALRIFGCLRLGARIWDLRRLGYPIGSKLVNGKKHYAIYWLEQ
jgi:hypothetical protein